MILVWLTTYLPTHLVLKCKKFREWTCEISKEAESRAENLFTSGSSLEATLARRVRKVLRNFLLNQPKKSEEKILFRLNWDWFTLEEEAVCDANIKMDSFRNYFSSFQDGFFQELSFILPKLTLLGTIFHPLKMDHLGTIFYCFQIVFSGTISSFQNGPFSNYLSFFPNWLYRELFYPIKADLWVFRGAIFTTVDM